MAPVTTEPFGIYRDGCQLEAKSFQLQEASTLTTSLSL